MAGLRITRTGSTAEQLRAVAARQTNAKVVRRLLAIAMVLDGHSRQAAATAQAMDRQTLRDWVIRYNQSGIDGLMDRPRPGRPALLSPEQQAELETWVEEGPDLAQAGVARWRRFDLSRRISERFGVAMHERTVGKILWRLKFRPMSVRPQHPQSDEAAQAAFKKRARTGRPPVAVETDFAIVDSRGAAEKFLVDLTPQKNVVHGLLRTCEW
jgi:transposase